MISRLKTKIIAGAGVIGLGGLAGVALNSNPGQTEDANATASATKPRVHVVHRTVRRTKHYRVKDIPVKSQGEGSGSASAAAPALAPAATPVSTPAPAPVVTQSSGAPASSAPPVTTSPSGGAGGGYSDEGESEAGDDGEGGGDD